MQASKAKGARSHAAAAAGAIALLALVIGVANPARGTDGAPDPLAGGDLSATVDVAATTKAAMARLGGDYGGAWIDRSSGTPVLEIAAAGSENLAAVASGLIAEPGVELVAADTGLAELERGRDRALDALPKGTPRPIAIDADPSRGAVVISAAGIDPAAQARIASAAGIPVLLEGEDALTAELVKDACPVCYPPWRAGVPIRSGRALCTGAFTVLQGKRHKHKFRALTAGHCQTDRRSVHASHRRVGRITRNSFRGERRVAADALRFKIPRRQRRARLALPPPDGDVPVIGKLPDRALVPGQYLCFSGRTTGGGCGYLTRDDIALRIGKKTFTHLWCVGVPTRPGDSGGPVVQPRDDGAVRAAGLVDITLQTNTTDEMCFSSIELVLQKMDVRLLSARR